MNGIYIDKSGQKLNVVEFDAENKIAYVELHYGQRQIFNEADYSTWEKAEYGHTVETSPNVEFEETTEVKKKKTTKKTTTDVPTDTESNSL